MKKVFKDFFKQVLLLAIIIAMVLVIETIFINTKIKGNYDYVKVGFDREVNIKEMQQYLRQEFVNLGNRKIIEVEQLGKFGKEFRVKSPNIQNEEKDMIKAKLIEKYGDKVTVSEQFKGETLSNRYLYLVYVQYVAIILVFTFLSLLFINGTVDKDEQKEVIEVIKKEEDKKEKKDKNRKNK